MRGWKRITTFAILLAAGAWPAVAEANGEHVHFGDLHFDPWVGAGVALFVGLITFMFVAQWVRLNATRRRGASTRASRRLAKKGEETTDDNGQEPGGQPGESQA